MSLIEYRLKRRPEELSYSAGLYEYIFAGNGVFVRGKRDGMDVQMMLASAEVRGLSPADEFFKLDLPRVPAALVTNMLGQARAAAYPDGSPLEILFYLVWREEEPGWDLITPVQYQTATSCSPINKTDPNYQKAVIEVHSHHQMQAFFSSQDDKDEAGFKVYAVLGEIFTRPTILVRAGLYGYFMFLEARTIFDLPEGIKDGAWPAMDFTELEKEIEKEGEAQ